MPSRTPRFRRPRWGTLPYELFDNATFLLILASIGYLFTTPPAASRDVLGLVYDILPQQVWGFGLSGFACAAIVCSYREAWVRRGMIALQGACVFWATCFAVGIGYYFYKYGADASIARVALSVVLYLWIASRLQRDLDRWDTELAARARLAGAL